jgi:cell division protein FtsW (lipid II flippase)
MLMTEPLGATLLAATTLCFLKACDSARPAAFAGSGLLLGATVMVRPEFLAFVVLLPTLAAIHLARRTSWRQVALPAGAIALAACLVILPWTIRNLVVLDRFVPVSTGGGQALFEGSYIDAGPDPQNIQATILAQHPELRRQLLREHSPLPPSGSGPFYLDQVVAALASREHPGVRTDKALAEMGRHAYLESLVHRPLDLASFLAKKAARVWVFGARQVMDRPDWKVFHLALISLALLGLLVGLVRREFDFIVVATILIVVTAIQAIFVASPRRTLLLLPLVCSLVGVGAIWLESTVRARFAAGRAEPP